MSDPTFQTPIYSRNKGSTQTVDTGGTVSVLSGGSVQLASGAVINVASGGSVVIAGALAVPSGGAINIAAGGSIAGAGVNLTAPVFNIMTVGGTIGKFAFGTQPLTSGVGTIGVPGFTRVFSATANEILGEASGAGTTTTVQIDLSLSGAGSIIFHTSIGTLPAAVGGTVSWMCWGT